jgi:uncharacterized protein
VNRAAQSDTASGGAASGAAPDLQPVGRRLRIGAVDVLRGFALLGVVVVNTQAFAGPPPPPALADRVAAWIVTCLFTAKSYSLFSLLFGLGFALQLERAEGRGQDFIAFFRRRCVVLLLFGVAHAVLLFEGDILTLYAMLGIVLLTFRDRSQATVIRWAVSLLVLAVVVNLIGVVTALGSPPEPQGGGLMGPAIPAYRTPSYLDDVRARIGPAITQALGQLVLGFPNVFSMFLLGLYLGRRGAFADIEGNLPLVRSLRNWGLLLGLPLNAVSASLTVVAAAGSAPALWLGETVQAAGAPLLMLGYVGSIVLLLRRGGTATVLGRLAPVGQISLTCYLSSSLLLNLAYYGFGLGLYGGTGAAQDLAVSLVVYLLLVLGANLYAGHYRYGPAEWLWRSLSYGRRQPIRQAPEASPA